MPAVTASAEKGNKLDCGLRQNPLAPTRAELRDAGSPIDPSAEDSAIEGWRARSPAKTRTDDDWTRLGIAKPQLCPAESVGPRPPRGHRRRRSTETRSSKDKAKCALAIPRAAEPGAAQSNAASPRHDHAKHEEDQQMSHGTRR